MLTWSSDVSGAYDTYNSYVFYEIWQEMIDPYYNPDFIMGNRFGISSSLPTVPQITPAVNDTFWIISEYWNETDWDIAATAMQVLSGGVNEKSASNHPDDFVLWQNYPNPFNSSTVIRFELKNAQQIRLAIYNMLGQEVRSLDEGLKSAGNHQVIWDGKDNYGMDLPSGLYFCRLIVEDGRWVQSIKIMLLR